jgi:site-specific recombinase XerD
MSESAVTKIRLPYVNVYRDRHGTIRRYVRRRGCPRTPLPGIPGSAEFMAAYQAALAEVAPPQGNAGAGTLKQLILDFERSAEFANLKASSKETYRATLGPIVDTHGHRLVRDLPRDKARKIIEEIGATKPGLANLTKKILHRIMRYAIATGLRADNPFADLAAYKLGTHHTWTDAELAAYEQRWPLGTRERLAYALLLYTGQRGGDVVKMHRSAVRNGVIRVVQEKTAEDEDDELWITIHPALARALKAGPTNGLHLVGDKAGKPMRRRILSNLIKRAAKAAGLSPRCVAHGLRKAALRRLAEHGSTTKEIAAVSGHRSLAEIERYTERASRAKLSKAAIGKLPESD